MKLIDVIEGNSGPFISIKDLFMCVCVYVYVCVVIIIDNTNNIYKRKEKMNCYDLLKINK